MRDVGRPHQPRPGEWYLGYGEHVLAVVMNFGLEAGVIQDTAE